MKNQLKRILSRWGKTDSTKTVDTEATPEQLENDLRWLFDEGLVRQEVNFPDHLQGDAIISYRVEIRKDRHIFPRLLHAGIITADLHLVLGSEYVGKFSKELAEISAAMKEERRDAKRGFLGIMEGELGGELKRKELADGVIRWVMVCKRKVDAARAREYFGRYEELGLLGISPSGEVYLTPIGEVVTGKNAPAERTYFRYPEEV